MLAALQQQDDLFRLSAPYFIQGIVVIGSELIANDILKKCAKKLGIEASLFNEAAKLLQI
ncbi:hypothetical protein ACFLZ9_02275 [Patescibacteria group bacterium]